MIATGEVLSIYNRLTTEELVMLINVGGELPANAYRRQERMIRAFIVIDAIESEQMPRPGVQFEAIDPHQLRHLDGELVTRKTA